ncbi:MAG: hypothetical protein AAF682_12040 [Planctomycetota bacterium]
MPRTTYLLLFPALALLLSFAGRGTELAFGPVPGTTLEKKGTGFLTLSMRSLSMTVGGEVMDLDAPDTTFSTSRGVELSDTYGKREGGRLAAFERSYERLAETRTVEGSPNLHDVTKLTSPLEGARVAFAWNAAEERYDAAFADADEERDAELLEDLDGKLDYDHLLPKGEVSKGDSWTLRVDEVDDLVSLGGELHFESETEDTEQEDLLFEQAMGDNLAGEMTCTFAGLREVDGRELAAVTLALAATGFAEDDSDAAGLVSRRSLTVELELEGELLWDPAGRHLASFELGGKVDVTRSESSASEAGGDAADRDLVLVFDGELTMRLTARPADS